MQNEILKPVLDTDEVAVPRYDIVGPNGAVIQQNVELRLKNEVVQEGTPMSKANILNDDSEMELWGTIGDRTPNDAFSLIGRLLREHDEDIANLSETLEGKIVTGAYTGNYSDSSNATYGTQTINLGFTPKIVFARENTFGAFSKDVPSGYPVYATQDLPVIGYSSGHYLLRIVDGGFTVATERSNDFIIHPRLNKKGTAYVYIAIT